MMPEIEVPIKFDFSPKKAIIIDVLLMLVILCAFVAGFMIGERMKGNECINYYEEYINKSCYCFNKDPVVQPEFPSLTYNLSGYT